MPFSKHLKVVLGVVVLGVVVLGVGVVLFFLMMLAVAEVIEEVVVVHEDL